MLFDRKANINIPEMFATSKSILLFIESDRATQKGEISASNLQKMNYLFVDIYFGGHHSFRLALCRHGDSIQRGEIDRLRSFRPPLRIKPVAGRQQEVRKKEAKLQQCHFFPTFLHGENRLEYQRGDFFSGHRMSTKDAVMKRWPNVTKQ